MTHPAPTPQAHRRVALAATLLAGVLAGCGGVALGVDCRETLHEAQEANDRLRRDLDACRKDLAARDARIETLLALGDRRLEKLFRVESVKLGRYTGGLDVDGEPGDEGVRVLLQPVDRQGSTLKATGDVTIELYDLAADADRRIGQYHFPVEEIGEHWSQGFGGGQFSFDCLWQGPPPTCDTLTVRAVFVDYLTGRTLTAQEAVEVSPPALPATRPADS